MRLQKVAQREAGQLMEAGGVGGLEEACERQLQAAMHPTYVAALNTRHQSVIGIRVTFWYRSGIRGSVGTNGLQILIGGSVLRITDPDPALF